MHSIINGLDVRTQGNKESKAIIFIHGFPFDKSLWKDVIATLESDYYCVSYDIRGFGTSEYGTGQYTMEHYVKDLEDLMHALKLDKPILCGFSMGGYIALRAHEKFAEALGGLILANTQTLSDSDEARLKRAQAMLSIDEGGMDRFIDGFFTAAFSEAYTKAHEAQLTQMKTHIQKFSPIGIKGGLLAMMSRTDTTQSFKETHLPVLLVSAENDKIIAPEVMQEMAKGVQNATLKVLSHSGHVSMIENLDGFIAEVKSFLDQM